MQRIWKELENDVSSEKTIFNIEFCVVGGEKMWLLTHHSNLNLNLTRWFYFYWQNTRLYSHFLSYLDIELVQAVEILPQVWQAAFLCQNKIAADGLVTQGARASAAMVLMWLSQNILVSAPQGLTHFMLFFFWEAWKYICIFCRFSKLRWHRYFKSFLDEVMDHLSYKVNILAPDILAMPRSWAPIQYKNVILPV